MAKTPRPSRLVREPVQVYLAPDDSALLNRLAEETGLSKAELLRRGIKSYAREQQGAVAPMLRFLAESSAGPWPSAVAADHDAVLAESYLAAPKKRR
jgi:Ribbon-helix-helix protein, copG family